MLGSTGSGKTTFGQELARRIGADHIELDALFWESGWTEADDDAFLERVRTAIGADAWVCDGNYSKARDLLWPVADTAVWLDLPFPVVLWQLTRRTFRRSLRKEQLWDTDNTEDLRTQFFTRDSLFLWLFQTFWRRRRRYPEELADERYGHLDVHRLRSRRQVRRFLDTVGG